MARTVTVTLRRKAGAQPQLAKKDPPQQEPKRAVQAQRQQPQAPIRATTSNADVPLKTSPINPFAGIKASTARNTSGPDPEIRVPSTSMAAKLAPLLSEMRASGPKPQPKATRQPTISKPQVTAPASSAQTASAQPVVTAAHAQRRVSDTYDPLYAACDGIVKLVKAGRVKGALDLVSTVIANKAFSQPARVQVKYVRNTITSFVSSHRSITAAAQEDQEGLVAKLKQQLAAALKAEKNAVVEHNARVASRKSREEDGLSVHSASTTTFVPPNHKTARELSSQIASKGVAIGKGAVTFVMHNPISAAGKRTIEDHFNGSTVSGGSYLVITDAIVVGMTAAYAKERFGAGRNKQELDEAVLDFADTLSKTSLRGRTTLETTASWNNALWAVTFSRNDLNVLTRACGGGFRFRNWGMAYATDIV